MTQPIYLDYAAATPVDSSVAEAMAHCLTRDGEFANAAAAHHAPGRRATQLVAAARDQVAGLIGARSDEIIWTSGATEANNLAILGAAKFRRAQGRHVVTGKTEHASVIEPCRELERSGWQVTYVLPDAAGVVTPAAVRDALREDTTLVSIMHVNNEIGVVQDIAAVGQLCREHGALLHVDAAQSAGRLPIDVMAMGVDLMSLSAQKLYGPKGVGALYLGRQRSRRVAPLMFGGGHERGLRPGTVPTHQVVGMGAAFALAAERLDRDAKHTAELRDRLWSALSTLRGMSRHGAEAITSGHILCVTVDGVEGESLLHGLDERGLAVSAGAACAATGDEPSTVLRCLGLSDELARASLRFSVGRETTAAQVDAAAAAVREVVTRLQHIADRRASDAAGLTGAAGQRAHGAAIEFHLSLADERIADVEFSAYGCPHTLAACDWLQRELPGRPVAALEALEPDDWMAELAVPAHKRGRMLVVQDALRNCLAAWDNKRLYQQS